MSTEIIQRDELLRQIAIYERTTAEIMTCDDIGRIRDFVDLTRIAVDMARRLKVGREHVTAAVRANAWAQRRMGQVLAVMPKQGPGEYQRSHGVTVATLADLGIGKMDSSRAQSIAAIPEARFEAELQKAADTAREITTRELIRIGRSYQIKAEKDAYVSREDRPGSAVVTRADALDYLESIEPGSVDLLLTDPPYMTDVADIGAFARSWLALGLSRVKPTGRAYIFVGAYPIELHAYLDALIRPRPGSEPHLTEIDMILPWVYRNTIGPGTATGYRLNWQACLYLMGPEVPPLHTDSLSEKDAVQEFNAPDGRHGLRWHPWEKPLDIAERFIVHATMPGDTVLDPFAGTGTFAIAASRLGRHAIGCEADPEMLGLCEKRGVEVADAGRGADGQGAIGSAIPGDRLADRVRRNGDVAGVSADG